METETVATSPMKARLQKLNEWGNAYSGAIAVAGLALTAWLLLRRRA